MISYETVCDKKLLKNIYGHRTYQKGLDYYLTKKVLSSEISYTDSGMQVIAKVAGSKKHPYHLQLDIKKTNDLQAPSISSFCSCPLKGDCKHVVAALLSLSGQENRSQSTHPINQFSTPQTSSKWGHLLKQLKKHPQKQEPAAKSILGFALKHPKNSYIVPELKCGEIRLLKNGRFSKPSRPPLYDLKERFQTSDLKVLLDLAAAQTLENPFFTQHLGSSDFSVDSLSHFSSFQQMVETGSCFLDSDMKNPLRLGPTRPLSCFWKTITDDSYQLVPSIQNEQACLLLPIDCCWYIDPLDSTCGLVETRLSMEILKQLFSKDTTLALEDLSDFKSQYKQHGYLHEIPCPPDLPIESIRQKPVPRLQLSGTSLYYSSSIRPPQIELSFQYGSFLISIHNNKKSPHIIKNGTHYIIERDIEKETHYIDQLQKFPITKEDRFGYTYGNVDYTFADKHHKQALAHLHQLEKNGWQITVDSLFPYDWFSEVEQFYIDLDKSPKENTWFDLELGILVDGEKKSLSALLPRLLEGTFSTPSSIEAIRPDQQFVFKLPDNTEYRVQGDRLKKILKMILELYDKKSKKLGISSYQAHEINHWDHELDNIITWKKPTEFKKAVHQIQSMFTPQEHQLPKNLQATLRAYQKQGYQWLQQLRQNAFGGILADDMGLGKTIQTLSLLLAEKEEGRKTIPSLLVVPTSLIANWEHEAMRFTPTLKVLLLHGNERKEQFDLISDHDIVITTYPLVVRDQEVLLSQHFYYIILDEAHYIKNPLSKVFQILCQISAKHRLCLSGTPIQNNLGELWSLFHFLNKGLFGSRKRFSQYFRTPIEKHGCMQTQEKLSKRAAPFLLRRTKDEVVLELPPKNEIIKYISFEESQRDLYETIRVSMLEKIRTIVREQGLAKSQIIILDALLKMRQVCCDPGLVKMTAATSCAHSAKLEYLMQLLEELEQKQHKVLLFSSFTSMLEIIEQRLMKSHKKYVKLTGQTRNRKEVIETFQTQDIPIFLISLKAGGVGLNLTAANNVIIYDPWWNPAAESQASDRAHRIGQDKSVFVYKLIAEKTIEEKILELQQKKAALAKNLYSAQEIQKLSLSMDEIETLFSAF